MCGDLYHPVTRPPHNPSLKSRKTSREHMQTHPNALHNVKRNSSKHKKIINKQERLILDEPSRSRDKVVIERSVSWNNLKQEELSLCQRSLSASNLYALSDPNLSLKKAVVQKAYDKPNTKFAKEKAQFIAWSQKYYFQLTVGCGSKECKNAFCKSSKIFSNFKPAMCAVLSVQLAHYEAEFLCISDQNKQNAKVLDKDIFNEEQETQKLRKLGDYALPFLSSFYSTTPFRSLFLPCPLTSSGLDLQKTHSVNELSDITDVSQNDSNLTSRLKSGLFSIASNISSSLSNLLSTSNSEKSNNNGKNKDTYKRMANKKQVSFDSEAESTEPKVFLTRKRLSSVRMFGSEHAVDTEKDTFHKIDDFEESVAEEFRQNNTAYVGPSENATEQVPMVRDPETEDEAATDEYSLTHLSLDMFDIVVSNYLKCRDESLLLNTLRTVFSSWKSLNLSFYDETLHPHLDEQVPFNLKTSEVEKLFTKLTSLEKGEYFLSVLTDTVKLTLISRKNTKIEQPVDLKPIAIIMEIPNLSAQYQLIQEIASIIKTLPKICRDALASYFAQFKEEKFRSLIKVFMSQLTSEKPWNTLPLKDNPKLCNICNTLELFYQANRWKGDHCLVISNEEFYCREITSKIDFKQEYAFWKRIIGKANTNQESILNYPFLLDPAVKVVVMHIDAITQMREEYQDAIVHQARVQQVQKSWNDFNDSSTLSNEVRSAMCPYLLLEIRRDNFIEDTLKQLQEKSRDLKKPLKIKYTAGGEQGLDMGGLQKEFFQVVVETMFDPNYSLFTLSEDGNLAWFNAFSFEADVMFELVGILLGLAIYNGIILDVHFPLLVYKKLLGFDIGLADLREIQPTVSNSLEQLLQYTGDVESDYCLTFEVSHSIYGSEKKIVLIPDGENVPVTNDNCYQFVELYVDSILNKSVERQFAAFKKGFYQVCNGPTVKLFTPPELELLICGSPQLDFKALEEATEYKDGYTKNHVLMLDFWKIVHTFTFKQKQALLMFVTGSFRVPLKGLGSVSFFIQRNGPDSNNLPTSMTCFNRLLLPEYNSPEKLKRMLLLAIENAKGFGLT